MNKEQPSITMSVVVRDDFSWVLQVQGRTFDPLSLPTLPAVWPTLLCSAIKVHNLLKLLGSLRICPGIPDEKFGPFAQSRKGKFLDHSGKYTEAAMYPMFLCVYIHCLQSLLVLNSLYSEASGLSGVYFIIFHYSHHWMHSGVHRVWQSVQLLHKVQSNIKFDVA